MLWVGALALLCSVQSTFQTDAGLKGRITQKGLDYGRQVGMEVLKSQLQKMVIPDISGTHHVPVVGDVDYTVSGIQIQDFQLPESVVGLSPGTGIKLSISNAKILITGYWHVKVMFIRDSGSFDLSVDGLTISAVLGVTHDESGRPAVWNAGCSSNVGGLHVTFHGGASWLYNLFTGALEGPLRGQLNANLCPEVDTAIGQLEGILKTIQVSAQIDPFAEIDYSLVSAPQITDQNMDLDFKGEFYNVGHHSEPPYTPAPFSILGQSDQMLYIGVSEFFANSAGFVYFTSGALQINLTDNMIPKESPIRLNTESFGAIIPELPKRYPSMPMMLHLSALKQPMLTCQPGRLDLAASGSVAAFVILRNSTLAPVFLLQLDSTVKGQVFISEQKISGSLALNNFTVSLTHSDVGPFKVETLQTMLFWALQLVVIPEVNAKLREGFPLPTIANLRLVTPTVTVNQGHMLITTDVQY
ncbi:bactericidal permeability-increasing protein-like [Ambystoma mexicanum]|uniref:bactericidal permeability-increasing protein-like n=1 Tax=Ambystoma mexicanum TaxID=8296 RepID=UPI0037E8BFFB